MTRTIDEPSYRRWTFAIAALLLIALIAMWLFGFGPRVGACCGSASDIAATAPPATIPPPPTEVAPPPKTLARFALVLDGDKRVLEGTVPDQATKERLLQAANAAFGTTNVVDKLAIDASVAVSKCAENTDTLFAALKTDPPIGIDCDRDQVIVTGTASSDADKAARERWAHDFFGAGVTLVDRIDVVVPQLVTRPEDVRCGAHMPAAVTFATASSRIDLRGRALLDAIAPCLKQGNYEIAGHTDSIGVAEDNVRLSKARAEAVRAYMILKGVDADRLVAVGYGADRPIGDNATRDGRAKNRRIEFARK